MLTHHGKKYRTLHRSHNQLETEKVMIYKRLEVRGHFMMKISIKLTWQIKHPNKRIGNIILLAIGSIDIRESVFRKHSHTKIISFIIYHHLHASNEYLI